MFQMQVRVDIERVKLYHTADGHIIHGIHTFFSMFWNVLRVIILIISLVTPIPQGITLQLILLFGISSY